MANLVLSLSKLRGSVKYEIFSGKHTPLTERVVEPAIDNCNDHVSVSSSEGEILLRDGLREEHARAIASNHLAKRNATALLQRSSSPEQAPANLRGEPIRSLIVRGRA